jgi:hypothetical protein
MSIRPNGISLPESHSQLQVTSHQKGADMSARRKGSRGLAISIIALVAGLAVWLTPAAVSAQDGGVPESSGCSNLPESSCYVCHAQTQPVSMASEWHAIHARQDCCWNCHGGNAQTMDQDQAHVGLMPNPLDDIYLSCHPCHPDDYQQRADRFAAGLDITPKSSAPITVAVAVQLPHSELVSQPPITTLPGNGLDSFLWPMTLVGIVAALLISLVVMRRKLTR